MDVRYLEHGHQSGERTVPSRSIFDAAFSRDGRHLALAADPTLAMFDGEPIRSVGATAPVIYDGHLLVRDDDRMFCYDVRRDNSASPPAATQKVRVELPRDPVSAGKRDKNVSSRSVFVPTPQDVVEQMLGLFTISTFGSHPFNPASKTDA